MSTQPKQLQAQQIQGKQKVQNKQSMNSKKLKQQKIKNQKEKLLREILGLYKNQVDAKRLLKKKTAKDNIDKDINDKEYKEEKNISQVSQSNEFTKVKGTYDDYNIGDLAVIFYNLDTDNCENKPISFKDAVKIYNEVLTIITDEVSKSLRKKERCSFWRIKRMKEIQRKRKCGLAFPSCQILAFISNIIEIQANKFKLIEISRSHFSQVIAIIGNWLIILEIITFFEISSNSGLIVYTSKTIQTNQILIFSVYYYYFWHQNTLFESQCQINQNQQQFLIKDIDMLLIKQLKQNISVLIKQDQNLTFLQKLTQKLEELSTLNKFRKFLTKRRVVIEMKKLLNELLINYNFNYIRYKSKKHYVFCQNQLLIFSIN
ncbi:unnamed protein product [Paramecium sonneborni]|uniref:Anoctamin transmembrane domain-containing protein n=1 Tax=Paramecium sonneborni TaxID=65129 RepID=A0A8S1R521_9CILI|nr:unnamed protein product [Paramecium sonneborni]